MDLYLSSKVLFMLRLKHFVESGIGWIDVFQIGLVADGHSFITLSRISHAILPSDDVGLSIVVEILLEFTEDSLMSFGFAQFDLLDVCEVVGDVFVLIAILLHLLEIGKFHFFEGFRLSVGVFKNLVDGLLLPGLAILEVGLVDGFLLHGVTHEFFVDHPGCSMLW